MFCVAFNLSIVIALLLEWFTFPVSIIIENIHFFLVGVEKKQRKEVFYNRSLFNGVIFDAQKKLSWKQYELQH